MIRFIALNLVASGAAFILLFIIHDFWGQSLFFGKIIGTIGGMGINFIGSRFWVFRLPS